MFRQVGGHSCPTPLRPDSGAWYGCNGASLDERVVPPARQGDSTHLTGSSFPPDPHPHLRGDAGSSRVNHIRWVQVSSSPRCRGHSCWHLTQERACFHARCTQNARTDASIALHDAGAFICLAGLDVSPEGSSCKGARRYTPTGMHGHWRPGRANNRADDGDRPCGFR